MRITAIAALEFRRAMAPVLWNPATVWRERRAPILVIETETGLTGIGECWSRQDDIGLLFDHLRMQVVPRLIGRAAGDREAILAELWPLEGAAPWVAPAAASGVDMALWDLAARREGLSLAAALGGSRAAVPVYASGGLYGEGKGPEQLAAELAGYVAEGFTCVKMKIGGLAVEEDLARVAAARAAIGEAGLIVDGLCRYDRAGALALTKRLADLGVTAIQAPVDPADIDGMALLVREGPLPVIGVESEWRFEAFEALLSRRAVSWLQFNPGLAGGPTQALRLLALTRAHGVPATPQCHATAVLQSACLHLGARNEVVTVEYHRVHDHLAALLPDAMRRIGESHVSLPAATGLGVARPTESVRAVFTLRA